MKANYKTKDAVVYHGNCLDVLKTLADNSVDAIITDPPYDLTGGDGSKGGFMGNSWDATGVAFRKETWEECLRVLKPGGHLLSFGGTRTWHRMATAIEDAGFEIRDNIMWIYGKAFPKSHNISKAIDRKLGAVRQVIGVNKNVVRESKKRGGSDYTGFTKANPEITAAATDEAKQWEGWGTALKPCVEPIVLARKPVEGTVAENVLKWGTGGINIDGSRIPAGANETFENVTGQPITKLATRRAGETDEEYENRVNNSPEQQVALDKLKNIGRFPANIILDEEAAALMDKQSGHSKSGGAINRWKGGARPWGGAAGKEYESVPGPSDEGGASRFFYVAKAGAKDRSEGLEGFKNEHPTVKPTKLMQYLCDLITPPGGTILDPFTGSGSTGKAALLNGYKFIGIEMTEEYLPIIEARLKHAAKNNRVK